MLAQMQKVASSPVVAILGAGAALANPGAFIPIALKDISELDPSATQYIVDWVFFSLVSLLPLAAALVLLLLAPGWTKRALGPCAAGWSGTRATSRPCSWSCWRSRCSGTGSPGSPASVRPLRVMRAAGRKVRGWAA